MFRNANEDVDESYNFYNCDSYYINISNDSFNDIWTEDLIENSMKLILIIIFINSCNKLERTMSILEINKNKLFKIFKMAVYKKIYKIYHFKPESRAKFRNIVFYAILKSAGRTRKKEPEDEL